MIAIDLGSNTVRGIELSCDTLAFGRSYEQMVKTADQLSKTKKISAEGVKRVIDALLIMKQHLDFDKHQVVAKTTAALRMAENSDEVIDEIYKATSVKFEIIDAQQEAFYTQLAVKSRLETLGYQSEFVLLDVGGGSTEVIVCHDDKVHAMSVDVGIVTMSQTYTNEDELVKALYNSLHSVKEFISNIVYKPKILISTAGTPTTMASMKQGLTVESYDPTIVNGTILDDEDLTRQLKRLLAMDEKQRALHVGVGRDILIITGVEILRVLMDLLGFNEMMVIDDGLREGLAIHSCKESSLD